MPNIEQKTLQIKRPGRITSCWHHMRRRLRQRLRQRSRQTMLQSVLSKIWSSQCKWSGNRIGMVNEWHVSFSSVQKKWIEKFAKIAKTKTWNNRCSSYEFICVEFMLNRIPSICNESVLTQQHPNSHAIQNRKKSRKKIGVLLC